jgi:hypothetical protein
MTEDRRTKAQLLEAAAAAESRAKSLAAKVEELEARIPAAPKAVPEANALAGCIRALDTLKDSEGRSSSYSYGSDRPTGGVARTILALCEKYGVPRFEKVPQPCERRHIEDLTAMDVMGAVQRQFEGFQP